MLVDGAVADVAAAGQGHDGLVVTAQQGPQQVVGRPHLAGFVLIGRAVVGDGIARVDGQHVVLLEDARSQFFQDADDFMDILYIGYIVDGIDASAQDGGGNQSQHGVFGTGDPDFAFQRTTTFNY